MSRKRTEGKCPYSSSSIKAENLGAGRRASLSCNVQPALEIWGSASSMNPANADLGWSIRKVNKPIWTMIQDVSICTSLLPPSIFSFLVYRHRPFNKDGMDKEISLKETPALCPNHLDALDWFSTQSPMVTFPLNSSHASALICIVFNMLAHDSPCLARSAAAWQMAK